MEALTIRRGLCLDRHPGRSRHRSSARNDRALVDEAATQFSTLISQPSTLNSPVVLAPCRRGDAVNAWICWPRLGQSFWHDENYPLRNAIVGSYRKSPDGSLRLKPVSWQATFFFYRKPNHTLYSGIARACNEGWRLIAKPKGLQFSEPVIRLPAFVAGVASIATIALLLKELEFASAGVAAAFLSALHPWHIRYASEARAYAFVLCLIPLVIFFLLRAVRNGRWLVVDGIRNRGVLSDVFLSHMRLRHDRSECLCVPGDFVALGQRQRRSNTVYASNRREHFRGHALPATDASLRPPIPRLCKGNTRPRRTRL